MKIYKRKKLIERLILIGPMEERKQWISWCYDNGYRTVRVGPKILARRKYSTTKFRIIAEKEIKK